MVTDGRRVSGRVAWHGSPSGPRHAIGSPTEASHARHYAGLGQVARNHSATSRNGRKSGSIDWGSAT
jgi:hypothetical protein